MILGKYNIPKVILIGISVSLFSVSGSINHFLMRYSNNVLIMDLINKINGYSARADMTLMDSYVIIRYVRLALTIIYLLLYRYVMTKIPEADKYREYGDFFLLVIMFALGAYRQYDTFVRSNMVMYFMACPFIFLFLKHVVAETPFILEVPLEISNTGRYEVVLYMMVFIIIVFSLTIYLAAYYPSMDSGFLGRT